MYFPDFSDYLGGNPFETTNEGDEFYVEDVCSLDKKPIYVLNMLLVKKYREYHSLL